MREVYGVSSCRGNEPSRSYNATFSTALCRKIGVAGHSMGSASVPAHRGRNRSFTPHLRSSRQPLRPRRSPYGSCDDHSGEHLPTSGPSNDAPARGSSAFGPHATPSDRDGAPSGARAKSSGLTPARFSRHDEPLSRIDAAFSPAADPSGRSPAASAGLTRDSIGRAFDSLCRSRHQVRTTRHSVGLPPHSVRTPPRFEFPSHEADLSFHSR